MRISIGGLLAAARGNRKTVLELPLLHEGHPRLDGLDRLVVALQYGQLERGRERARKKEGEETRWRSDTKRA